MIEKKKLGNFEALVYTPDGYQHKPGNMAFLFLPGNGELSGIDNLYKYNTLGFIQDGKYAPDFVVAAISPNAWAYPPADAFFSSIQALQAMFPGSKVVGNGLSLGAANWVRYVNSGKKYSDSIAGLIIMSSSQAGIDNLANFKGKPVIGFLGEYEPSQFKTHHPLIMDAFRAAGAVTIEMPVPGMAHGPWTPLFDPNYQIADTRYGHNNIYEYMRKLLATAAGELDQPVPSARKLITTIKIYDDGSIEKI